MNSRLSPWTVTDTGPGFIRVVDAALHAIEHGVPLTELLPAIRAANPHGSAVDVICNRAKAAGDVPAGTVVWRSTHAALTGTNGALVTGRTSTGGVLVLAPGRDGSVQERIWQTFALECERAAARSGGEGLGYGGGL